MTGGEVEGCVWGGQGYVAERSAPRVSTDTKVSLQTQVYWHEADVMQV